MGFQLSPGVNFKEIDATGIIPAVSVSDGAYAGPFLWGPVEHVKLMSNETELVSTFGRPNNNPDVVSSFFTCANFLAYGDKLRVVRSADTSSVVARQLTIKSVDLVKRKITFNEDLGSTTSLPSVKRRDKILMDLLGEDAEDLIISEVERHISTITDEVPALNVRDASYKSFILSQLPLDISSVKKSSWSRVVREEATADSSDPTGKTFTVSHEIDRTGPVIVELKYASTYTTTTFSLPALSDDVTGEEKQVFLFAAPAAGVKVCVSYLYETNSQTIAKKVTTQVNDEVAVLDDTDPLAKTFLLENAPIRASLVVTQTLGNVSVTTSAYTLTDNEIVFTTAPAAGTQITASYQYLNSDGYDLSGNIITVPSALAWSSSVASGATGQVLKVTYSYDKPDTVEIHWASELSAELTKAEYIDASVVVECYDGVANATADKLGALIKNDDDYTKNFKDGQANVGAWAAKYPGEWGNSLRVSVCASADAFEKELSGTVSTRATLDVNGYDTDLGEILVGTGTNFLQYLTPGSVIVNKKTLEERTVVNVISDTLIKIDQAFTVGMPADLTKGTVKTPVEIGKIISKWEFHTLFTAPGTSVDAAKLNVKNDELHIVVIDDLGSFTGIPGTILEKYSELSKASNAKLEDGTNNYYKDVINKKSKYVRWTDHLVVQDLEVVNLQTGAKASGWGKELAPGLRFHSPTIPHNAALSGAKDALDTSNAQKGRFVAYDLFKEADKVDVALIMMGNAGASLTNHVIDNVATKRLDCVVFCSPPFATVFNNFGNEAEDIVDYRRNTLNANTSYAVMDSGWKVQIDKYNGDKEVYVPLNGDIAGLCARTDTQQEPWWSPAGYSRGQIKNCVKLLFNPDKTDRDELYKNNINPVIEQPGEGRLLFGDKTLLTKPSAFDRINVRRLFIVLEKAISRQAKYLLFEFNDEFTRQQFRSMVEPYLRDVQSKRGIYDFRVVCDKTNNTPEIIDRNEFVGDIYIKPARSINFIQLNFIAVRTGVEFSEIVGKV